MSERSLGNLWADTKLEQGGWVCKVPASVTAGLPDWLLLNGWLSMWEAKLIGTGKVAFDPKAEGVLRSGQRFFLRMLARYSPMSGGVLLLAEDGYWEVPVKRALRGRISSKSFHRNKEPYHGRD